MPRSARIVVPGLPLHVRQRGHNRAPCFFGHGDYTLYLGLLRRFAEEHECRVHAYCLMTNHVHLLLTPRGTDSCALMMKRLAQCYTQHINRVHERTGSLWESRFRSCVVSTERYLLTCYRYVELNPVAAKMAVHPREYRWSSYRANAEGWADPLVTPHEVYPGPAAYRDLCDQALEPSIVDELRKATNGGYAAGSMRKKPGRQPAQAAAAQMRSVPI